MDTCVVSVRCCGAFVCSCGGVSLGFQVCVVLQGVCVVVVVVCEVDFVVGMWTSMWGC